MFSLISWFQAKRGDEVAIRVGPEGSEATTYHTGVIKDIGVIKLPNDLVLGVQLENGRVIPTPPDNSSISLLNN